MTTADKLLAILEHTPRKFLELRKLTGMSASGLRYHLHALRKNNEIHATGPHHSLTYHHGPAPAETQADDPFDRPGGVTVIDLAPGHRKIKFGRDWKPGKGLTSSAAVGVQSGLNNLFMAA